MVRKFVQKAKIKKGALSKQLGIKEKNNIPISLLNKIIRAKVGETISNPTKKSIDTNICFCHIVIYHISVRKFNDFIG